MTTITLYNAQHEQTTDALVAAFEEKYPNITVKVRSDDEDVFDAQIVAEGSRSPADVIYTENSPALEYLQQRGLLAPVDASTLAKTPGRYNSPDGDWVGVSARVSVLIYNPSLITRRELPTTVLEMAEPKYKGKLAFAVGESDFQPIVTAVDRVYGRARTISWLEGLKANSTGHQYPDNETIVEKVNQGQAAFGLINQYYWYRYRDEFGAANVHSALQFLAPRDPGFVVDVSGAGILKSSTHRAADQKFLAFLVSAQGQLVLANSASYEYPIASGVATHRVSPPLASLKPYPITIAQLGTGSTAIDLLRETDLL